MFTFAKEYFVECKTMNYPRPAQCTLVLVSFALQTWYHHAAQLNASSEPSTSASLVVKTIDATLAYLPQNSDEEFQIHDLSSITIITDIQALFCWPAQSC